MMNKHAFALWFIRDGRLRSGWRVTLYIVVSFATFFVFAQTFGAALYFAWLSRGVPPDGVILLLDDFATKRPFNYPEIAILFILLRVLLVFGNIWLFRRYIDKRSLLDLGFQMPQGWQRELGAGFLFALSAWILIIVLTLAFGVVTIDSYGWRTSDLTSILGIFFLGFFFNLIVGVAEEADARGYILQNLAEGVQFKRAVLISALYFGAAHLFNSGAGVGSTLGILVAGVLFATGYYITGRLWFSIGMHAAWNFAEGPLFGFPVSGFDMNVLLHLKIAGPEWLMGGTFGPEAGLLAVLLEIAMIWLLVGWKRGRLNPVKDFLTVFFAGWGWTYRRDR